MGVGKEPFLSAKTSVAINNAKISYHNPTEKAEELVHSTYFRIHFFLGPIAATDSSHHA